MIKFYVLVSVCEEVGDPVKNLSLAEGKLNFKNNFVVRDAIKSFRKIQENENDLFYDRCLRRCHGAI